MKSTVCLEDLTRDEIAEVAADAVAVFNIGAIEQHGPHLAIGTDHFLGAALAKEAAEKASKTVPAFVVPELPYGFSDHHKPHPGVVGLSPDTLLGALRDIVTCLVECGFQRVLLLNSHGGNEGYLNAVAREMNIKHNISIVAVDFWKLGIKELESQGVLNQLTTPVGHADGWETSLMLHIRPDLVYPDKYPEPMPKRQTSSQARVFASGSRQGLNAGYKNDPSEARRELGQRVFETASTELAKIIVDLHGAEDLRV